MQKSHVDNDLKFQKTPKRNRNKRFYKKECKKSDLRKKVHKILLVSRHKPTMDQKRRLEKMYKRFHITQFDETVDNIHNLAKKAMEFDVIIVNLNIKKKSKLFNHPFLKDKVFLQAISTKYKNKKDRYNDWEKLKKINYKSHVIKRTIKPIDNKILYISNRGLKEDHKEELQSIFNNCKIDTNIVSHNEYFRRDNREFDYGIIVVSHCVKVLVDIFMTNPNSIIVRPFDDRIDRDTYSFNPNNGSRERDVLHLHAGWEIVDDIIYETKKV